MYEHSNCCNAPVHAVGEDDDFDIGGSGEAVTMHYECTQCGNACDVH